MIHVEVQGKKESNFLQRLFEYYYRLHDRYQKPILTLVILADSNPSWRPDAYRASVWGHSILEFKFFIAKLLDYAPKATELAKKPNPFGLIVLAHLEAQRTKQDPQKRYLKKRALTRYLYEQGLERERILTLYKFVDWVLTLPDDLEIQYNTDIHQFEEELNVSYITTAERIGIQKGIQQGKLEDVRSMLRHKMEPSVVAEITGLSVQEVLAEAKKLSEEDALH
jgi:predicted transposase/invertase (TIGR01784 family)